MTVYTTRKAGRPKGSKTINRRDDDGTIKRVPKPEEDRPVKDHPPLVVGDVWRVRLGDVAMLSRDRVLRIVSFTANRVTFAEVPTSSFEPEFLINNIEFIDKVVFD